MREETKCRGEPSSVHSLGLSAARIHAGHEEGIQISTYFPCPHHFWAPGLADITAGRITTRSGSAQDTYAVSVIMTCSCVNTEELPQIIAKGENV